jgi:hypothetical protein
MLRFVLAFAALACAACASSGGTVSSNGGSYWQKPGATGANFSTDNQSCSARASRMAPTARADQISGGVFVQDNGMDRPPRKWLHPAADGAYMDCMIEHGWTTPDSR